MESCPYKVEMEDPRRAARRLAKKPERAEIQTIRRKKIGKKAKMMVIKKKFKILNCENIILHIEC